jgi:VWFA-related protein
MHTIDQMMLLVAVLCLALGVAWGQTEAPATFRSGVDLVSVAVVVRDGKGRAVGGLRQEDFRLFDKGKPQIISKFNVEHNIAVPKIGRGGERTAETEIESGTPVLPDRFTAYVFDDVHLKFEDLARVRAAAERHFAAAVNQKTRAAIYTTSGRVGLDFTDDREKIHEALLRLSMAPGAGVPLSNVSECPPGINPYEADLILYGQDPQALAAGVAEVVRCYGPIPKPDSIARGVAEEVLARARMNAQVSLGSLKGVVRRLSAMPGSRGIVLVSPGFLVTSELRAAETDVMEEAARAKVTISSLGARGLFTNLMGEASSSRESANSLRMRFRFEGAKADGDVMAELADGTGGKFFHDDNGFEDGLNQLAAAPEYVYLLGFSPQDLKFDGKYHALKVTLKKAGLDVQARRGYWAGDHAVGAEEQIREAVFSQTEIRDVPLDLKVEFVKRYLTVTSHIEIANLQFEKREGRNRDDLTVVTSVFSSNGVYVKGVQRVLDLKLLDETLEALRRSGITLKEGFEVAAGSYIVRVVVRDGQGESMAARNASVEIP